MGWLRLVGSLKSWVSFAEYRLFYRALWYISLVRLGNVYQIRVFDTWIWYISHEFDTYIWYVSLVSLSWYDIMKNLQGLFDSNMYSEKKGKLYQIYVGDTYLHMRLTLVFMSPESLPWHFIFDSNMCLKKRGNVYQIHVGDVYLTHVFDACIWYMSYMYSLLHLECFIQYESPVSISLVDVQQKVFYRSLSTKETYRTRTSNEIWDWRNDTPNAICCIWYMFGKSFMTLFVFEKKRKCQERPVRDLRIWSKIYTCKHTYFQRKTPTGDLRIWSEVYTWKDTYIQQKTPIFQKRGNVMRDLPLRDLCDWSKIYWRKDAYIQKKISIFKKRPLYSKKKRPITDPIRDQCMKRHLYSKKRHLYSKKDGHQRDMNTCQLGKSCAHYCNNNILQHTATATHCNTHYNTHCNRQYVSYTTNTHCTTHCSTHWNSLQHTLQQTALCTATHAATRYNTLQHTATHCITHCNTRCKSLQHTLQHTAIGNTCHTRTIHMTGDLLIRQFCTGVAYVCVAECCSVLQCVAVCVLQCFEVCCSVLQCATVRCCHTRPVYIRGNLCTRRTTVFKCTHTCVDIFIYINSHMCF